jgi:hypothetical protein
MFCFQSSFTKPTLPVDEAQFSALVKAAKWTESIDKYRETGDASLKRKLPAFIFQATFDETQSKKGKVGRWRKQASTRLTGLVVMDIDHVENPREIHDSWLKNQNLKELGVLLVYITPSGKGLKIVFKARVDWGNLIDNQHQMAKLLGVSVDESCKDASRMSFICKEEDILYLDKELFTYENREFAEKYGEEYRNGKSGATIEINNDNENDNENDNRFSNSQILDKKNYQLQWRGYNVQDIINARFEGKMPCKEDSNRHAESLKLASDLLVMLDGDKQSVQRIVEAQPWVKEIIEERNENVGRTVESAAEQMSRHEGKYSDCMPSKLMQEAIQQVCGKSYAEIVKQHRGELTPQKDMNIQLLEWGKEIDELSNEFPLLKDICKGLKYSQFPAAMFVAGGLLMTLMTRCTYRFYHRPEELRRLNNSTLIIGDPTSGKSFATRLYRLLSKPIIIADKAGKAAVNAYREQLKIKGANKDKPKRPKVPIRVHPARTSNSQFIQDMVNSVETIDGVDMQLHMLTFDTELDNTIAVQKGGSWIDKQCMELKAFHNEEDGQAYSNADSVLEDFFVTWNFIYTGTPIALKRKVNNQNFGSGLATRLTCIPLPSTNYEMMSRERDIDYESNNRLTEWAEKLDRMKGELSLQKIVDELYDWTARRMADARENDSRADEMLLKRCAYHGLNFSAPFIVMRHWDKMHEDGSYWCGEFETDETDWKLAELIVNIQYACQKYYFGAMAEDYFDNRLRDATVNVQRRQKTYEGFMRLPEEFTTDDVMRCFQLSSSASARGKISRLLRDHLIKKIREERGTQPALFHKTGTLML